MHEAFDIQRYPQPWITYALTHLDEGDLFVDTGIAYSLRQAYQYMIERMTGAPLSAEHAKLSWEDAQALIDQLNEAQSSENLDEGYQTSWRAHPTPGPWAQAERDQLFDWLYSFVSRYVDMPPLMAELDSDVDRPRPLLIAEPHATPPYIPTIWRRIGGHSEMSPERLAELLLQEDGIEVDVDAVWDADGRRPLRVRLVRELPDGSPEALGLDIRLDVEARGGRPPVLDGRYFH